MTTYTDAEMDARVAALSNVKTGMSTADGWMSLQPAHVSRYAKPATQSQFAGQPRIVSPATVKLITARYDGRCATCGGRIMAGDRIRYDGQAHHDSSETCFANEQARRDRDDQDRADAVSLNVAAPTHPEGSPVRDGTYTIVRADGSHQTLRVRTQKSDASFAPGKTIVAYLFGSDNESESSYKGFAFLNGGKLSVWSRFASNNELRADAAALLTDAATAGERYALESGRCFRCNHKLTVPASIYRGLGPECAKR